MSSRQGDIVLLPYPFSNLKENKVRPAIIISNNTYNKKSVDCVMVPMTSVIKKENYSVLVKRQDLSSGHLLKTSRVRVDKIFSIEKNLIVMKIGKLNDEIFQKIKKKLIRIF